MSYVREAVATFLKNTAAQNTTLVSWWHPELETQVQVISNRGEETDFGGYTLDGDTWWHIRWPSKGKTDPTWSPKKQTFDLSKYAESIGTSGWNWEDKKSEFVCFDLDSIENHAEGLSDSELQDFIERGTKCDYVDVLTSTSGKGIHYYVRFDPESLPPAENRNDHKQVAHYVLSQLKNDIGENLIAKLDVCGNIFWIWSRRMTDKSYQHLSSATKLLRYDEFPDDWKDKADVVKTPYSSNRITTSYFGATNLTAEHDQILKLLANSGYTYSYDSSERRAMTHTKALEDIIPKLPDFVGAFSTKSEGTDTKQNCFMYPVDNGGFTVFRFGNVKEDFPWKKSKNKNYYCLFNSPMDPVETFLHFGFEHQPKHSSRKERYCSDEYEPLVEALKFLGCDCPFPKEIEEYATKFYIEPQPTTDDSLRIGVDSKYPDAMKRFELKEYNKNHYKTRVLKYKFKRFGVYRDSKKERETAIRDSQIIEMDGIEHVARHTKQQGVYGVAASQEGQWWVGAEIPGEGHRFCKVRSDSDVIKVLQSEYPGLSNEEAKIICGGMLKNPWLITCVPFAPEYPRERQWNMDAPRFAFRPAALDDCEKAVHPTWDTILAHCGQELDEELPKQPWFDRWGIHTGKEYLTAWIACMLFEPDKKLPYLFLHGNQGTGKSSLHEAIERLMVKGKVDGARALTSSSAFNGELDGLVLARIEEIDLSRNQKDRNVAYERIKDWTVAPDLSIRHLYRTPYSAKNYLHFIQVANKISSCPMDQDDTRITVLFVPPFKGRIIPEKERNQRLDEEAPHFMVTLKRAFRRLPPTDMRLRLPVVKTQSKERVIDTLSNELIAFIRENCVEKPTKFTPFAQFYRSFISLSASDVHESSWPTSRVKKELMNNHYQVEGNGDAATVQGLVLVKKGKQ